MPVAYGALYGHMLDAKTTHHGGYVELDIHNLWALMEEKMAHLAVKDIPNARPFLISRSVFLNTGQWSGH